MVAPRARADNDGMRVRPPLSQPLLMTLGGFIGYHGVNALFGSAPSWVDTLTFTATWLTVALLLWRRSGGIVLGPTGFRRSGGTAAYWAAVEAVTLHRDRYPVIWLKSGQRIALGEFNNAPFSKKHAERAYHRIGQWWL
jgi:hypothetical protein